MGVNLPRSESKIGAQPGISSEKVLETGPAISVEPNFEIKCHVSLTSTAKVGCREPDIGIIGKEQRAPGVALRHSLR